MAKNKKKLRKKLRHELLKNIQQQPQSSPFSADQAQVSVSQTQVKPASNSIAETISKGESNLIIKKDVALVLIIFIVLTALIILAKYFDSSENWVLIFADWLNSLF